MKRPYIVGIAGGTASGKTTLASRLPELLTPLRVNNFMCDRYYRFENPPKVIAPFTGIEYRDMNVPEALRLEELYADFAAACEDPQVDVLLIEGLFTLYLPEIREKLDLKVFVDLPSDERLIRRIRRWMPMGQTMDEIADRYLDTVRYRHDEYVEPTRWYADVVVNGALTDGSLDVLATYIRAAAGRGGSEA